MEKEERIRGLESELNMLIEKSKGLDRENEEITKVLTLKAQEYHQLTGKYYRASNQELW